PRRPLLPFRSERREATALDRKPARRSRHCRPRGRRVGAPETPPSPAAASAARGSPRADANASGCSEGTSKEAQPLRAGDEGAGCGRAHDAYLTATCPAALNAALDFGSGLARAGVIASRCDTLDSHGRGG